MGKGQQIQGEHREKDNQIFKFHNFRIAHPNERVRESKGGRRMKSDGATVSNNSHGAIASRWFGLVSADLLKESFNYFDVAPNKVRAQR